MRGHGEACKIILISDEFLLCPELNDNFFTFIIDARTTTMIKTISGYEGLSLADFSLSRLTATLLHTY